MSQEFTDGTGQQWTVPVDGSTLHAVQAKCGVLLLDIIDENQSLMQQLYSDWVLRGNVLWTCCKEQAESRKVSEEDFFKLFSSEKILDEALSALIEGIANFCTDPQRAAAIREIHSKVEQMQKQLLEQGGPEAIAELKEFDASQEAEDALKEMRLRAKVSKLERQQEKDRAMQELEDRLTKASSNPAGSQE